MTQAEETALQTRQAMWLELCRRCTVEHGGEGAVSGYGRPYEVLSMRQVVPADATEGARQRIAHLITTMLFAVDVPRPGGVLVVRGPASEEDGQPPGGIRCEVKPIGGTALNITLSLHAHAVTLEEARAQRRPVLEHAL